MGVIIKANNTLEVSLAPSVGSNTLLLYTCLLGDVLAGS